MDLNVPYLFLTLIFSSIGLGYFLFGKRQQEYLFLFTGLALMVYPYMVSGTATVTVVGLVLSAGPFVARFLGW
ncbi:MAG TPA: amino acid transport protein [Nitrospiria bacterium]|nr:amino acid transport protein [Nitrospiria bacterium]